MRFRTIGIFFLLLPIIEIAGIILVGNALGLWSTLALILGTSLLGVILLRANAISIANKWRQAATRNEMPEGDMLSANMRSLGAVLMIFPGFLCKLVGLAFMLPPFQTFLWALIGRKITVFRASPGAGFRAPGQRPSGPSVVDLDQGDYERHSNAKSPWYDADNKDDQKRID